ncbi:MAG: tetratricopeptide repeat protein [Acidobacteriaceae bacterium]
MLPLGIALLCPELWSAPVPAQTQERVLSSADRAALHQALADEDAGRLRQAEPVLRRLAERYPANDQVSEALGLLYAEGGEITQALPYLRRACRDAPQSAIDHANLGTAWLKLGQARRASAELTVAAGLEPGNAQTLSALGQAYMLLQQPAQAGDAFGRAAAIEPDNPDLLYNWAVALADQAKPQQAVDVLNRIPEREMSDAAESLAGELEEKLGHFMAAVAHDQRAAQMNPSEANLYLLCVEFLRHWAWDDARKAAEFGAARYPDSLRMRLALGVALYGDKKFQDAARVFAGLLHQHPDNSMVAEMLGRTCEEVEGADASCQRLEDFARGHADNPEAAAYAARQILERPHSAADLEQADRLLAEATAADPRNGDAWYELGRVDAERGLWQQSAQALEKATALRPEFGPAHLQLATAYRHLGRLADEKRQLALFQGCTQQEKNEIDAKVRAMTVFLERNQ